MKLSFTLPLEYRVSVPTKSYLPQSADRWLGVPEMAELKGCSEKKVRALCQNGIIPATKEGLSWTIPVSLWNAYCAAAKPKRVSTRISSKKKNALN